MISALITSAGKPKRRPLRKSFWPFGLTDGRFRFRETNNLRAIRCRLQTRPIAR